MSSDTATEGGPDLAQGVPIESFGATGMLAGHVGDDAVTIARVGDEFLAIDAACSHYHAPLADGLIVGDTVRCPWHHACFSLHTGRRCERLPWVPSRAGPRRFEVTRSLYSTNWLLIPVPCLYRAERRRRSSLSAPGLQDPPLRNVYGDSDMQAV